ncbi:SRPBCC family protein [Umezawaea sp. Da 62-37]|uniref:SRPBCC family protein n=1 Tax=Umezawaea sp. Da 62-37 TaxID=3075927 RepID=UPI0028F6C606|nr:SRPBCC family protein [Umezawaea sp. Da 62-37]WNV88272.1 SRPBCC family protein [Umezawaea sp. Da 62-37]
MFTVLADGWTYAGWVVSAAHIRDVDEGRPVVGTRIHHSVGTWPSQLEDETAVRSVVPGDSLEPHAKARPAGTALIRFELTATEGGMRVRMAEKAVRGPGSLVPEAVRAPAPRPRNREALLRLRNVVVRGGHR